MKSWEKLRLLMESEHLSDKEVYRGINMPQPTFSSKKLGTKKFKPDEKRAIEKLCGVREGYLDDDCLSAPVISFSKRDLMYMLIDVMNRFIGFDERLASVEEKLSAQGGRKKK